MSLSQKMYVFTYCIVVTYHAMDRSSHFTPNFLLHAEPGTVLYYRTCTVCILYYETTPERMMNQMIFKWIQSQQFPSLTRSINRLQQPLSRQILRSRIGFPWANFPPYCTLLCSFSLEAWIKISFFTSIIFHKDSVHSPEVCDDMMWCDMLD